MSNSSEGYVKSSSHSKMNLFKIEHLWKIDQFSDKIVSKNKAILSSMFSSPGHDIQFQIQLFPQSKGYEEYIGLYLTYYPGKTIIGEVPITFQFVLLKNNGEVLSYGGEY